MLAAMFGKWEADGTPHYPSMKASQHIAYISDVGANPPAPLLKSGLNPLFIAMGTVSVVTFDIAFFLDRILRHFRRLAPNTTTAEKVLSVIASIFAVAGAVGLILLTIFDDYNHPRLHDGFLLLFIGGYIISAIFTCAEYQQMGIHQRQHRHLRLSFWLKLTFIIVELALAIAFAVIHFRGNPNTAAIIEWVVALIYTGWVLSFCVDLYPASHTGKHHGGEKFVDPEENIGGSGVQEQGAGDYNPRYSGATLPSDAATSPYHGDGSRTNYGGYRGTTGRVSPGPAQTMSSASGQPQAGPGVAY